MVVVFLAFALVAGVGAAGATAEARSDAGAGAAATSLTVTFWTDEQKPAQPTRWSLRCGPTGGSLPTRRAACRKLEGLTRAAFAPVPQNAICTQIWGGPQKAVVKGRLDGKPLWASFRRRNGCEIERWERFSPWLIPPGGAFP